MGDMATATNSEEVTIDMVMREIFVACDRTNCGKVPVSDLIDHIKPFLQDNLDNLTELKMVLDPTSANVEIDQATFYKYMRAWAQKITAEESTNMSYNSMSTSTSPELLISNNKPTIISADVFSDDTDDLTKRCNSDSTTPSRASFRNRFVKSYLETSTPNISICSESSFYKEIDKSFFEDQIKELLHQNKKFSEELALMRMQYGASEEQNEALQIEIKDLSKQLSHEREVNENLQKEGTESDDLREVSISAQKNVEQMKRAMHAYEKEIDNLKQSQSTLEFEKQQLQEKLARVHDKMQNHDKVMVQLQLDLEIRDKELSCLEEVNTGLRFKLREQEKVTNDCQESINCLQAEKDKLQKVLFEKIKEHSHSISEYLSTTNPNIPPILQIIPTTPKILSTTTETISPTTGTIPQTLETIPQTPETIPKTPEPIIPSNDLPFESPINTKKFKFYNNDCPVVRTNTSAKNSTPTKSKIDRMSFGTYYNSQTSPTKDCPNTKTSYNSIKLSNKSICNTPEGTDVTESPPHMYVVARTVPKKNYSNISLSDSMIEDMNYFSMNTNLQHESLAAEFSKLGSLPHSNATNYYDFPSNALDKECQVNNIDEEELSNNINELYVQVKNLTDENKDLKLKYEMEKSKLQLQITQLDDNNNNSKKLVDNLKLKLEQNAIKLEQLKNEKEETVKVYENKLKTLEEEIEVSRTQSSIDKDKFRDTIARLEDEADKLKVEIFNKEKDLEALKKKLETDFINWSAQVKTLSNNKLALEHQLSIMKLDNEVIANEQQLIITNLKTKLSESISALEDLKLKHSASCQMNEELHCQIKELEKDKEDLNKEFLDKITQLENTQKLGDKYESLRKKRINGLMQEGRATKFSPVRNAAFARMEKHVENLKLRIDELEEEKRVRSSFTLKEPLASKFRPISPDSPNLGLNSDMENKILTFEPKEQCSSSCDNEVAVGHEERIKSDSVEPQDLNDSIYEDAFGTCGSMCVLDNLGREFKEITNECLSEEEMEEKFKHFVLEFQLGKARIKENCEHSFMVLNSAEMKIIGITQQITEVVRKSLTGKSLRETDAKLKSLLENSIHVIRSAEQFGAIKQDYSWLKKFNVTISYVASLKDKLEKTQDKTPSCTNCNRQLMLHECPMRRTQDLVNPWRSLLRYKYQIIFLFTLICALFMMCHVITDAMDLFKKILVSLCDKKYLNGPPPM